MRIVSAPVPGVVSQVLVQPKEHVVRGQILLELTVMGMRQQIAAPRDGVVRLLLVRPGDKVGQGALLLELAEQI